MSNTLEFSCWSVSVVAVAWMLAAYPQLSGVIVVSTEPLLEATCVSVVLGSGLYLCVARLTAKLCGLCRQTSAYEMRHRVSSARG
jgi:ABC-type nickel/cobalt efflux system permease component RcnA